MNTLTFQLISRKDEAAWSSLIKEWTPVIAGYARRILGADAHGQEEVAQDVFLRVYDNLAGLDDPHAFPGWISRIAVNVCRDRLRSRLRRALKPELASEPSRTAESPTASLAQKERRATCMELLEHLPDEDQEILLLGIAGVTNAAIAEALGMNPGAVYTRRNRALNKLRDAVAGGTP